MNTITALEQNMLTSPQNAAPANSLHPHEALDILLKRRFGVEYQPIVDTVSGDIQATRHWLASGGRMDHLWRRTGCSDCCTIIRCCYFTPSWK